MAVPVGCLPNANAANSSAAAARLVFLFWPQPCACFFAAARCGPTPHSTLCGMRPHPAPATSCPMRHQMHRAAPGFSARAPAGSREHQDLQRAMGQYCVISRTATARECHRLATISPKDTRAAARYLELFTGHGSPGNQTQATRGALMGLPPAYGKNRTEHELAGARLLFYLLLVRAIGSCADLRLIFYLVGSVRFRLK
jgi:hypothetical protein